MTDRSTGEPHTGAPSSARTSAGAGSFGDLAAEMANETEVEEPVAPRHAHEQTDQPTDQPTDRATGSDDISGIENFIEEGAPLEPSDDEAESASETVDDAATDAATAAAAPEAVAQALSERTADLQRLQAEYLNYKRRVERDRELVRENATYAALAPIVDVLDTIDRAREHGDLDEGLAAVAEQLERVVSKAGLVRFGEPGDPFDPRLHEALSHIGEDPEVDVTTAKIVAKAGYRIGERVVRAAQVLVVDPATD